MSDVTVGRWGKNLAVRLPGEVVKLAGIKEGERVEIEAREGDILIRRSAARARAAAQQAADEIMAEAQNHRLDDATIRELLEEGRRG